MKLYTAFVIVGVVIASTAAFAQQAGSRASEENPRTRVEAPAGGCGFLGIYPSNISRRTAEKLLLADQRGAIVEGIFKGTGAERAGIREKDVITALNGVAITSEAQLRRLILAQTPGAYIRLDLMRSGQPLTINAEISSRSRFLGGPDCSAPRNHEQLEERRRDAVKDLDLSLLERRSIDEEMRNAERELDNARRQVRSSLIEVRTQRSLASGYDATTGMRLQTMSEQLAKYFNTGSGTGALVSEVADGSPALRAGMQAGDVIVAVNGSDIDGPMDAVETILADRDGSIELTIVRDAERRTVRIGTNASTPSRPTPSQAPSAMPDLGTTVDPQPEMIRRVGAQDLQ